VSDATIANEIPTNDHGYCSGTPHRGGCVFLPQEGSCDPYSLEGDGKIPRPGLATLVPTSRRLEDKSPQNSSLG